MRDMEQKPRRLVIVGVKGKPGYSMSGALQALGPRAGERTLAKPRCCPDDSEAPFLDLIDQAEQTFTTDKAGRAARRHELGGEDWWKSVRAHMVQTEPGSRLL